MDHGPTVLFGMNCNSKLVTKTSTLAVANVFLTIENYKRSEFDAAGRGKTVSGEIHVQPLFVSSVFFFGRRLHTPPTALCSSDTATLTRDGYVARVQLELLPEILTRCIAQQHQQNSTVATTTESRRNFLHPESAAVAVAGAGQLQPSVSSPAGSMVGIVGGGNPLGFASPGGAMGNGSTVMSHSRSVPPTGAGGASHYHWPTSPILPPISSRTPHLVPEPIQPSS